MYIHVYIDIEVSHDFLPQDHDISRDTCVVMLFPGRVPHFLVGQDTFGILLVVVLVPIHSYDRWRGLGKPVQNFDPSSKNYQQSTVHWEYPCHNVELLTREPELECKYCIARHESLFLSSITVTNALHCGNPRFLVSKVHPGLNQPVAE